MKTCNVCGKQFFGKHTCVKNTHKQLGRDCLLIINKAFEKSNSGRTVYNHMLDLENLYPGIGFREESYKLIKFLERGEINE